MLFALSVILQIFSLGIGIYYIITAAFGFIPIKERGENTDVMYRFAVVVPAHDEAAVIAELIDSLEEMDYPKDKYSVFVIADNCSDSTAARAAESGFAHVLERTGGGRGKGYALEWFFNRPEMKDFDYVCVIDADNVADKGFLSEINRTARRGYSAVQGYVDSKNPYDSWVTASYTMCFRSVARVFQLARYRLGLCCQLSGTGFAVAADTIKRVGWRAYCLTEDMELTMRLALSGIRVGWAHNARVYDEKPVGIAASCRQRRRWMQGHWDVAGRYWTRLIKKAVRERDFAAFDCAVYLLQPVRIIALAIIGAFAYAEAFGGHFGFLQASDIFPPALWMIISAFQLCYLPFVLAVEQGRLGWRFIPDYFGYLVYNITWIPICAAGFFTRKQKRWVHTKHSRTMKSG